MKKTSKTIKFTFPSWDNDTGHNFDVQEVVEDEREVFVNLKFVNHLLDGTGFELDLMPAYDQHQKHLTDLGKHIVESR